MNWKQQEVVVRLDIDHLRGNQSNTWESHGNDSGAVHNSVECGVSNDLQKAELSTNGQFYLASVF